MNFYERVYKITRQIPKGKVATYSAIAVSIGSPLALRAVAQALARNRDKSTPCHRVVGADGRIGGYSFGNGGVAQKVQLLRAEGVVVKNDKIDLTKFSFLPRRRF